VLNKFLIFIMLLLPSDLFAREVSVADSMSFRNALENASPGDVITLSKGNYTFSSNLNCSSSASTDRPIRVRAEDLGDAILAFDTNEGFKVSGSSWIFENLEIHGICSADSNCEHAFHIFGAAHNLILRNNVLEGFNAHVKGNGINGIYPNNVLIEYNEFYSKSSRKTSNPVTPIDVVGGKGWKISHNFIHDFEKAEGNKISYAAFLKGNSSGGVFSHNLIVCESLHQGGIRLGLSFGGGGTGTQFCEGQSCVTEHRNGKMFNNIIANCPADVGIYINKGKDIKIYNNTLFNTTGIDVRFGISTVDLQNNLLDGKIRERNGGHAVLSNNLQQGNLSQWFTDANNLDFTLIDGTQIVDKGSSLASVKDDFCTNTRGEKYDIGAIEYDHPVCDTRTPFRTNFPVPTREEDMGSDAYGRGSDMGVSSEMSMKKDGGIRPGNDVTINPKEELDGCSTTRPNPSNLLIYIPFLFGFLVRRKSRSRTT